MWHYSNNNSPEGPVAESTIIQMIANGIIHAQTMVWREGMGAWMPLAATELAGYLAQVQSPPPFQQAAPFSSPYQPPQYTPPVAGHAPYGPPVKLTWSQVLWSFEGRIPRSTYWAGCFIWMGIWMVVIMVGALIIGSAGHESDVLPILIIPAVLLLIPYFWSALAIQVKRWHDRGKSGAMVLINLIPYIGGIWAFVECGCLRGTLGPNQYGQDPT